MQTKKLSLANIQGKLSRDEMKNIMAGNAPVGTECNCNSKDDCTYNELCIAGCSGGTGAGYCGCLSA